MTDRRRVAVSSLSFGTAAVVDCGRDASGIPVEAIVTRGIDGSPRVYRNLCKHLPVPLDGGTRWFFDPTGTLLLCGTHGALYRVDDGLCLEGPCEGEALEPMAFDVVDGFVVLRST